MSDDQATVILLELRELRQDVRRVEQGGVALRTEVAEVKALATATNGRLRKVEAWRAFTEGAHAALSWRMPLVTGVVCAFVGAGAGAGAAALFGG